MDMFGKKVGKEERASLEVAESSRQTEWNKGGFLRGIFEGKFLWKLMYPFPEQDPADKKKGDDYLALLEKCLRDNLDPDEVDRTGEIPPAVIQKLFELGTFALKIPECYGGLGLSKVNYGRVMNLISSYCGSTAVLLSAHQSIGVPQPLLDFGTEEQKKKFLPRFRKDAISGFALTEPDAGCDPSCMKTTAAPGEDGKCFILNGEKLWCTNGPIADILIVMALTPPKIVHGKEKKQITAFIVETKTPGFEVKHRCELMGIRGAKIGLISFKNVKVPRENIVAGEGDGLKLALTTLNTGRLTVPAGLTGVCKYALHVSRNWAAKRVQWGAPIGEHEAIAGKLSAMASSVLAMEAVTRYATHMAEREGADFRLEAAVAKKYVADTAWQVVNDALQIRGGRGYETSRSLKGRGEGTDAYPIERMVRDVKINSIVEGTSEIMNLFITREALDTHLKRMGPLFDPKASFLKKLRAILGLGLSCATWYPGLWMPVLGIGPVEGIPKRLVPHLVYAKRMSRKLARGFFHAMIFHRQAMAKKEMLAARYVDIGSELFAAAAVCAAAAHRIQCGVPEAEAAALADLFCCGARERIARKFREAACNRDRQSKDLSRKILAGDYAWLESDIIK